MASSLPSLQFYPADYLSDYKTQRLTLEEHGAYHLLLWHMWKDSEDHCSFPLDYAALGGIWRVCPEVAEKIVDSFQAPNMTLFKVVKRRASDYLFSKRLREQVNQLETYREQQAEKGRRSGVARRANAVNRSSTTVEPNTNQLPDAGSTETKSSSSSSLSSSNSNKGLCHPQPVDTVDDTDPASVREALRASYTGLRAVE
ncbi:MAG: YdaU family protein [Coriobacteriia bacterium]|nr:YdaU family protein [Coriobacteriia bacterium]